MKGLLNLESIGEPCSVHPGVMSAFVGAGTVWWPMPTGRRSWQAPQGWADTQPVTGIDLKAHAS